MARPVKQGLDYFPMDVEIDDKIELIEAKHGITGFGVVIKLFQRIYKEGYFLTWNEDTLLLFSKRINVDHNKVTEIINDCFKYNILDKNLHDKQSILTSSGIQKRYLMAVERRKEVYLIKRHIIVDINKENVNIVWIDDDSNTQSKVKESKVNYIYNSFYDSELKKSENNQDYLKFIKVLWGENSLMTKLDSVLKLDQQLTFEQFKNMMYYKRKYSINVTGLLESMENYKKIKEKKSLWLTFLTFMKNSYPETKNK